MKRLILFLSFAVPALAVYTYTTIDALTAANSTTWQANGSPTYGGNGLNSSSAASLISKITTPGNANQYEVTAKLNLTGNGGSYYLYLKASQDAYTDGSTSTGTFFAFEVASPVFVNGACTATLNLWKRFNGNVYQMGTTTMPCKNGMTIHGVADAYNDVYLYAEGASYLGIQDFDITTGQPGIGIRNTTSNTISLAQVGPRDTVAPGTVPTTQVSTNVNWRSVEMQWQGAADDVHGIGISGYNMFRNGTYLGFKRNSTFVDDTLSPSTTYNYQFVAVDLHNNSGGTTTVPVTTPPLYQGSQWTTGVRSTGNYWGSMGENIDLLSGNLNYTIPLLSAKSRAGGANFNLTYNSQQWRQDAAGIWKHGVDSGYGWGWKLQAGSITPMYSDYWTIHHYIFIDSTGTEYYLNSNVSGIWRSQSGFYGEYDAAAKRLYFPDGSFWEFDAESTGTEQDAGTRYPTKMQDSNGNFIAIRYKAGLGVTWTNSSARIDEIEDARAIQGCISSGTYTSYKFTYNNDAIPHLTNIANCFNIGPNIAFTYLSNVNLLSPWSTTSYGTTTSLHTFTGIPGETHTFNYTGSLELSQMTTPSGGYLRWDYASVQLVTGYKREVQYRYWSTGGGTGEQTYAFGHPNDAGNNVHSYTTVLDASQTADKAYFWRADGLLNALYERTLPSYASMRITTPTWTNEPTYGRPYISSTSTTIDPGTGNAKTTKSDQTIDVYGNVTLMKMYDYTDLVNPARTYDYYYLHNINSAYVSKHIFNRVDHVTVQKPGGSVITLAQNYYDSYPNGLTSLQATPLQWDSTVTNYRGNVTQSVTPGAVKNVTYYITGSPASANDGNGHSVSMTMDASKNSAVPSAVTTGSLTSTFSWNGMLGITGSSGPNGATSVYNYDTQARPTQTTTATGQVVKYEYTTSPSSQLSEADGRWTKTTYDGLGRMLKSETGYQTGTAPSITRTTVSVVDTLYTPCGCSPLGKTWKVSLPHAPGGTVYWTEYVHDALGRTIQVKQPNNSGTATYAYAGNTVTSTDAASKWKKFESDALGNLTKVTEPNPAGGANLETTYTYSELAQLLTVSMPRNGVTQTRTFVYNSTTQRLTSTTNPENGTTTNYYNADGTLSYKIDAKNQKISYDYDSLMRVTAVHRFPNGTTEDPTQLTTFEYDANSVAPGFSQNVSGRLAVAKSYAATVTGGQSVTSGFYEMYSYDSAGRVIKKRLRIDNPVLGTVDKDIEYNFTQAKLNTVKYPDVNVPFTYYYDNMLRPNRMTGKDPNDYQSGTNVVDYVNSVNYNVASRMTSMWGLNIGTSTYTYNERFELTRQQTGSLADIQYEYSATADNGQILSRTNNIAAEKVTYQYDALKRLISASAKNTSTNVTTWASTYEHDGWGNLLSKTPTAGSAPSLSVTVNGLTNRINSGGYTYDNNGNMTSSGTFDVDNRLTTASGESYGYLTNNQRVYKRDASGNEWIYFHDANGKRIMTFQMQNSGGVLSLAGGSKNVSFGSRPIILNDASVVTDRLGSVVSRSGSAVDYFPYGEEKNVTANPAEKFGTYLRDATGLNYADQRYFASTLGRFLSSDPYQASAGVANPKSWNRYSYVEGDPIGYFDPEGLIKQAPPDDGMMCMIFPAWCLDDDSPGSGGGGGEGSGDINSQGGSAGAAPFTVTNFSNSGQNQILIEETLKKIRDALSTEAGDKCQKWLTDQGISGSDTINAILAENSFGHGDFSQLSVSAFAGQVHNGQPVVPATAAFTVNNNGAFYHAFSNSTSLTVAQGGYRGGTLGARAFILLHELAHIKELPGFKPDFGNKQAGIDNDKMVEANCGKMIRGLK